MNGSLVSEKEGERKTSYQYDLLNRQTHIKMPEGREQENFYDGEGLRAGLKEDGKASTFLFLNGEILTECDRDSRPIRRHLSGLGLSHVQTLNDSSYHAYHQDEQGSTAYITGGSGAGENSYRYDAFGNVLESRENIENRILYTGQQYDQEAGQYYLRARFYNPVIGRFTQEDTYRGDGLNLYAYCENNPVMYYDPSGHDKQPDQAGSEKQKGAGESGTSSVAKPNQGQGFSSKGYNPQPGERTFEGYVKQTSDPEISLYTKSSGFNNNPKGTGGQFKRFGANEHYVLFCKLNDAASITLTEAASV